MKGMNFKYANIILSAPDCEDLRAFTDGKTCVSLWKLTLRERISALIFGRVWLWVRSGVSQPPVSLSVERQIFREKRKVREVWDEIRRWWSV